MKDYISGLEEPFERCQYEESEYDLIDDDKCDERHELHFKDLP
jgi:hypothetical protein